MKVESSKNNLNVDVDHINFSKEKKMDNLKPEEANIVFEEEKQKEEEGENMMDVDEEETEATNNVEYPGANLFVLDPSIPLEWFQRDFMVVHDLAELIKLVKRYGHGNFIVHGTEAFLTKYETLRELLNVTMFVTLAKPSNDTVKQFFDDLGKTRTIDDCDETHLKSTSAENHLKNTIDVALLNPHLDIISVK